MKNKKFLRKNSKNSIFDIEIYYNLCYNIHKLGVNVAFIPILHRTEQHIFYGGFTVYLSVDKILLLEVRVMNEFSESQKENYVKYEDEYNKNANPGDPVLYPITFKVKDLGKMAKSMRFVAVMTIILGVLNCLSNNVVGGVLTVIAGVKLKTAAETVGTVAMGMDSYREELLGEDLLGFFKYNGITLILSLASSVIVVLNVILLFGSYSG